MDSQEQVSGNGAPRRSQVQESATEISVLDFFVVLARERYLIVVTVVVVIVLAGTYALLTPEEYTATARIRPEVQDEVPNLGGGFSALQGLGLNLGSLSGAGLSADAYPAILTSREVRLHVARDTFYFPEIEQRTTYVQYVDTLSSGFVHSVKESLFGETEPTEIRGADEFPTKEDEIAIRQLYFQVSASIDPETRLMTVRVTQGDPVLAAQMAQGFIDRLAERVRHLRTQKARQNLEFVQQRLKEAERELRAAEEKLATFSDRNQGVNTAELRVQRDRLQRRVNFKRDLYSEFQSQVAKAEVELQRTEPIVTVVESPAPPIEPSAPLRLFIILAGGFVGVVLGVGFAFVRSFVKDRDHDEEEQKKLEEIRDAFMPDRFTSPKSDA